MGLPQFREGGELHLKGFPICSGIAIGKPMLFISYEEKIPEFCVPEEEIENEVARYYRALSHSREDVLSLRNRLQVEGGREAVDILSCHLEMMHDPLITTHIEEKIREKKKNTEYVFKIEVGEYEKRMSSITDLFFRERVKDFQDISRRIISHLRNKQRASLSSVTTRSIIFAHELSPSDTAEANIEYVEAFVTRSGAETSHVAIMARSKGIPFVTNVDFPDLSLSIPPHVIVDGREGEVIINPSDKTLAFYRKEKEKHLTVSRGLQKTLLLKPETIDGYKMRLSANIEMFEELDALTEHSDIGIGLFRTEYLFLAHNAFPSEEEQFFVYKNIVEKVEGNRTVIRTFDIGGDKFGHFPITRHEKNPYLGCRATRLMLKEKQIFKTQLKAILRASAFGDVSILFPLISGVSEFVEAREVLFEAQKELLSHSIPFDRKIPIGCMIEVPSAALTADLLAKECDFFSIGTNDLVQYTIAVDRGNPNMSYLYNPSHPSHLRLIQLVVEQGTKAKIPISVCGEIAADPKYTALLMGLGVEELSVSTPALGLIKSVIRKLRKSDTMELAKEVMTLSSAEKVEEALNAFSRSQNLPCRA